MKFELRDFDWKKGKYKGYVKGFYLGIIPYLAIIVLMNFSTPNNLSSYLNWPFVFYTVVMGALSAVMNEKVFKS